MFSVKRMADDRLYLITDSQTVARLAGYHVRFALRRGSWKTSGPSASSQRDICLSEVQTSADAAADRRREWPGPAGATVLPVRSHPGTDRPLPPGYDFLVTSGVTPYISATVSGAPARHHAAASDSTLISVPSSSHVLRDPVGDSSPPRPCLSPLPGALFPCRARRRSAKRRQPSAGGRFEVRSRGL